MTAHIAVPHGVSWANLAWGFNNGGQDEVDGYKLVVVDLDTDESEIRTLRNEGHIVICYFSVGTIEKFRSDVQSNEEEWYESSAGEIIGWDEEWLDIQDDNIRNLQQPRFVKAQEKGCHGVEPDNIDCYQNSCRNNLGLSYSEAKRIQIEYNRWQTEVAHSLGLSIGLKNAVDIVDDLVDDYDFTMNESCQLYSECNRLSPFWEQNKAILNVEYSLGSGQTRCNTAESNGMSTKYCKGTGSLCTQAWNNCFDRGSPFTGTPPELPSFPATWANNLWDNVEDVSGKQVIFLDLDSDRLAPQELKDTGHHSLCYFSAGAVETSRPDYESSQSEWNDLELSSVSSTAKRGNAWLDFSDLDSIKELMETRFDRAAIKGCVGIVIGDLDCETDSACNNAQNVALSSTMIDYGEWLSSQAAARGLLFGIHTTSSVLSMSEEHLDFVLVEGCLGRDDCDEFRDISSSDKPLFNMEFNSDVSCVIADAEGVSTKLCETVGSTGGTCDEFGANCFEPIVVTPFPTVSFDTSPFGDDDDDLGSADEGGFELTPLHTAIGGFVGTILVGFAMVVLYKRMFRSRSARQAPQTKFSTYGR